MPALPTVGGDAGVWGTELNTYLQVAHNADGTEKSKPWQFYVGDSAYGAKGDGQLTLVSTTNTSAVITTTPLGTPATPTLSNTGAGGSLTAGTYQVSVTLVNAWGESLPSSTASQAISGTQPLTITAPATAGQATGWYAYVTQAGGSTKTRQQTAGQPTPISVNLVLSANPTNTGANPPVSDTSAPAVFAAGDVGKQIMINGGKGTTSGPLITTILSYQSATQVTLNASATATATQCCCVWATDDTTAINNAVAAAKAWALANGYKTQVLFGPYLYGLAGLTQSGDGVTGPTFNAQIPVPCPATPTAQKLVTEFIGSGSAGEAQYWEDNLPALQGTCLVCFHTAPSVKDATFGWQSVIGGPTGGAGFFGGFANAKAHVDNITIVVPVLDHQTGFDFRYLGGYTFGKIGVQAFATALNGTAPVMNTLPTIANFNNALSCGLRGSVVGNNAECVGTSICVEGLSTGVYVTENTVWQRCIIVYSNKAFNVMYEGLTGIAHDVVVGLLQTSEVNYGIFASGSNTVTSHLTINLDVELINIADVFDSGPNLRGEVHWYTTDNVLPVASTATKLKLINEKLSHGTWASPPSVPATTVAQANTSFRDAMVTVANGTATVTNVTVDGTQILSGPGMVFVPSGLNITLTYTGGTPTWTWVLL